MSTPIFDPRGYAPFGGPQGVAQTPGFGQVVDRFGQVVDRVGQGAATAPAFGQVVDRGPAVSQGFDARGYAPFGQPQQYGQVVDRGPAFGQVVDRGGAKIAQNPDPTSAPASTPGTPATAPPSTPAPANSFEDWYKNTVQANPDKYDTNISKEQWQAWFPLWTGSGFKSSKVDQNGNPIQGTFDKPDDCPPGMAAFGANQCRPAGAGGGGGGGGNSAFDGSGYNFGGAGAGFGGLNGFPQFVGPTAATEQNDPGYQFRLKQGQGALEASAAARGVLATGGTLDSILRQGQDYASSEFGNVWNRAKDLYSSKLAEYQQAWQQYQYGNLSAEQKAQLAFQMQQLQAQIEATNLAAINAATGSGNG